jgi:hypothetical protein
VRDRWTLAASGDMLRADPGRENRSLRKLLLHTIVVAGAALALGTAHPMLAEVRSRPASAD